MRGFTVKILMSFFLVSVAISAQGQREFTGGGIKGKVIESSENVPMEFANIVLLNSSDSSQVTGTVTNKEGLFEITRVRPGSYYVTIGFIGFEQKKIDNVEIRRNNILDLGTIKLMM